MLSVIIPTRNRESLLGLALQSLLAQTLSNTEYEVLVIDNGSTDSTREVVEAFVGRIRELRYFFEPIPGLHVGRHKGMKEARGDVLVYADDDIQATPTWLEAINECFRRPDVALVGGNCYPNFECAPPAWLNNLWSNRNRTIGGHAIVALSVLDLPEGRREVIPYMVWGCNFSIRKQALIDAGGFHPDSMPDELIRFRGDGETHVSKYVLEQGLTCLFDSRASVHHAVPKGRMTFEYFRKRAFNQGVSDSFSHLRSGSVAPPVTQERQSWRARAKELAIAKLRDLPGFDTESRQLDREMRKGYEEGYAYHQQVYVNDAEVRAWVHRPTYY
jgi:glycosyltransferase involved in cell wall biosynthesis